MTHLDELRELYTALSTDELREALQLAQAELVAAKRNYRDGLTSRSDVEQARADFMVVRGLVDQLDRFGAS